MQTVRFKKPPFENIDPNQPDWSSNQQSMIIEVYQGDDYFDITFESEVTEPLEIYFFGNKVADNLYYKK